MKIQPINSVQYNSSWIHLVPCRRPSLQRWPPLISINYKSITAFIEPHKAMEDVKISSLTTFRSVGPKRVTWVIFEYWGGGSNISDFAPVRPVAMKPCRIINFDVFLLLIGFNRLMCIALIFASGMGRSAEPSDYWSDTLTTGLQRLMLTLQAPTAEQMQTPPVNYVLSYCQVCVV